ncbi:MAG: dihydrodipicolinate synthase family protein [Dehalococcoidia bacterium]|jgi:4-hydroxy-tetrahydrodipicolinate synthase
MEFTKSEAKEWARKNYHGLDGVIQPSYTQDLESLDEEGIRHDVRHNIAKGVFSVFCAGEVSALSHEERKQFVKIVAEEAKGKVLVSMFGALDDAEQSIELLNYFESVGGTHTLLGWPGNFYAKSEEDIFQVAKKICDSINLAVDLWPKPFYDFGRFHPSGFNPALIERICQIPNVVAIKAYLSDGIGKWAEVHHRVGDQILLQAAEMAEWPITVAKYGQQWAGPADYVIFDQTGENPRIVRMFNLFARGEFSKGMELYWELAPITLGARDAAFQCGMLGMKYMQWLTGGNGGMFRKPTSFLFQHFKNAMRAGLQAAGVTPREPEEEFYVGRVNYSKGIRPKEYTA